MNRSLITLIVGLALGLGAGYGLARTMTKPAVHDMAGMDMSGGAMTGNETPATLAYMQANTTMHQGMAIAFSGDTDNDFIRGMIPHHQGAVEMAKIVLQYGKDPDVRKLAEGVVAAQESEISWMQDWLKAHPAQ